MLKSNPRLSPTGGAYHDYEALFITGLLSDDAQAFARWQGAGYELFTPAQWRQAYRWLAAQPVSVWPGDLDQRMDRQACWLWNGLLAELRPANLLVLSLMSGGVVEWTAEAREGPQGMGQPRQQFHPNFHDALKDKPFAPTSPPRRSKLWGLRLLKQG